MSKSTAILSQLEEAVEGLVEHAKSLVVAAEGEISIREIQRMQRDQEQLINRVVAADAALANSGPPVDEEGKQRLEGVETALLEFERLNSAFVDAIHEGQGLILFGRKDALQSLQSLKK